MGLEYLSNQSSWLERSWEPSRIVTIIVEYQKRRAKVCPTLADTPPNYKHISNTILVRKKKLISK